MTRESARMPDGAVLRVASTGSGPPLALCHGGPGIWDYLAPLAGLIGELFLVHRYHQRGCGDSTGDGPYTVAQFVADLDHLRADLGHADWWVGGHSWGAELALTYALRHPERVRGVVYLCGTGIGESWRAEYAAEMRRRLGDDVRRWEYLSAKGDRTADEEREFCVLQWRPDFARSQDAKAHAAALLDGRFRLNLRCNSELSSDRVRDEPALARECARLRRPVLIVHGAADPRPVWSTDSLLAALPRATRVVIDGAGHVPWAERPGEVLSAIRDFVNSDLVGRRR